MVNKVWRINAILRYFLFLTIYNSFKYVELFRICILKMPDDVSQICLKLTKEFNVCSP